MSDDPIIDELYRNREAFAKRFNFDVKAMARHIRENSTVPAEKRVVLTPRPLQRRTVVREAEDDYGKQ